MLGVIFFCTVFIGCSGFYGLTVILLLLLEPYHEGIERYIENQG